jgi:hypothetical protein
MEAFHPHFDGNLYASSPLKQYYDAENHPNITFLGELGENKLDVKLYMVLLKIILQFSLVME